MEIDIFKNPPSKSDIAQWRDNAQQEYARKQEDRLSTKVFMYCPIPIVDVIAGLATLAVEEMSSKEEDDPRFHFQEVDGGLSRDWSESKTTLDYVEKVRAENRQLLVCEFAALNRYLQQKKMVNHGIAMGVEIAADFFKKTLEKR